MRHARFENINEPIFFLLRPICCHDLTDKLDELIASEVMHVHRTLLMIVGVQHLSMIPRSHNYQVVQIVDTAAMLNWYHVVQDVLIILSYGLLVRHKRSSTGSHTCPVCFTETCRQARVIGNSLPEGFAKIPECLEGFPLQLSADLSWNLPCTSMGSLEPPTRYIGQAPATCYSAWRVP